MTKNERINGSEIINKREAAQQQYEEAGLIGFVENFIEEGSGENGFLSMTDSKKELWLKIVGKYPSLLKEPPFFE